jgi:glycosyltransferase involved in cell wall biosynthesis
MLTQQLGAPALKHSELAQLLGSGFDVTWFHNISLIGGPKLLSYGNGVKIYEAHEHWLVCPTHVLWRYNREPCVARDCVRCTLSYRRPPQLWRNTGLMDKYTSCIDTFIAKSEFSRDKHVEFGFERPMTVVPYFLPPITEAANDATAPVHDKPYFLFVGRLEKIKGLQDVIPIFAGREGPDLLVAGAGEFEPQLRAMAADKPRIKFLGRVAPDALNTYYREALSLIVPSVCYETFGIILIEAMRQGTPVIARNFGPFPEIVAKGGGLLFDTQDELRLAVALMSQEERRVELSREAANAFARHWCEDVVIERYLAVLQEAAARQGKDRVRKKLEGVA